jgi:hypothetical protein
MLQLSDSLYNCPVLSLRSGSSVATAVEPIINPRFLKIEGFYCQDSASHQRLILLSQDIREFSKRGLIIDDFDVLAEPEDLVRLHGVLKLNFQLLKKPVETTSKSKVGVVKEYAVETTSMYVQKLYVSRPFWESLSSGSLSIDRTQIVEVTSKRIIINDLLEPTRETATALAA